MKIKRIQQFSQAFFGKDETKNEMLYKVSDNVEIFSPIFNDKKKRRPLLKCHYLATNTKLQLYTNSKNKTLLQVIHFFIIFVVIRKCNASGVKIRSVVIFLLFYNQKEVGYEQNNVCYPRDIRAIEGRVTKDERS
jgi:hypothetical protein